ncbi:MAG: ACP S-malonyltransferase [bacterium]|nr:ACP S-malonyltransferase [bacterium]
MLSPGQNVQQAGMGEVAYNATKEGKRVFDIASEVTGVDMAEVCFGSETERLGETLIAQPAIGATSLAEYYYLKKLGLRFDLGIGHSVGELPLLAMAKILPVRETFELMQVRAVATSRASEERPGMMAAINGLTAEQIKLKTSTVLASGRAAIANFNGRRQQVFSGDDGLMDELEELVREWRIREKLKVTYTKLRTGGAFHSAYHMENAVGEVYEAAQALEYSSPDFEVMLNNALYLSELGAINLPTYLSQQLINGVDFVGGVDRVVSDGVSNFVEVGPKSEKAKYKTLSGLIKRDFAENVRIVEIQEVNASPKISNNEPDELTPLQTG